MGADRLGFVRLLFQDRSLTYLAQNTISPFPLGSLSFLPRWWMGSKTKHPKRATAFFNTWVQKHHIYPGSRKRIGTHWRNVVISILPLWRQLRYQLLGQRVFGLTVSQSVAYSAWPVADSNISRQETPGKKCCSSHGGWEVKEEAWESNIAFQTCYQCLASPLHLKVLSPPPKS